MDNVCRLGTCWIGLSEFNVGLELRKSAVADGLGFIPEDDPETCHHNFDPPRRGWKVMKAEEVFYSNVTFFVSQLAFWTLKGNEIAFGRIGLKVMCNNVSFVT